MLTRFAPAPTGWLHLGHVLNAEYVWTTARERGGRVLLRIEDHDRERCRPEYERGILDDLDWLGYEPDVFPTDAFRAGRCEGRQSDREDVYREAVERLRQQGVVYACDCTRRAIAEGQTTDGELRYPGTCRDRGLPIQDGIGWRVRLDSRIERFVDERLGAQLQNPEEQCGDVLIRDRHGNWTYQFCVVVDDLRQEIDLVIRGEDLLPSTGRQIALARLLGREHPPSFLHHPLIMKAPGQKLSKSDRDTAIRDLRRSGLSPAEVRHLAAAARQDAFRR
ncbi:MAG TPA: glutamate--tRNA ligase family protein [Vicinamibacterales bacterium]|nr:glutamate--tRNA ligase family protein [Vicinamibacterales bacterium]